MEIEEILNAVQRAVKISTDAGAAMIVEYYDNGDISIATYGQSIDISCMKRALKNLLENE